MDSNIWFTWVGLGQIYGFPIQLNSHMGQEFTDLQSSSTHTWVEFGWIGGLCLYVLIMSLVEFGELYLYVSCLIKKLGFINHLSTFLNNKLF